MGGTFSRVMADPHWPAKWTNRLFSGRRRFCRPRNHRADLACSRCPRKNRPSNATRSIAWLHRQRCPRQNRGRVHRLCDCDDQMVNGGEQRFIPPREHAREYHAAREEERPIRDGPTGNCKHFLSRRDFSPVVACIEVARTLRAGSFWLETVKRLARGWLVVFARRAASGPKDFSASKR
jgi:hypothetical protein